MRPETPIVDQYFTQLTPAEKAAIADLDKTQPEVRHVRYRLTAWESLSGLLAVLENDDGFYPAEKFINDLEIRDGLEAIRGRLAAPAREAYDAVLARLDELFERVTVEDGGQAVAGWRPEALRRSEEWWKRRPRVPLEEE
jgi:hypothetical protein